MMRAIHPAVFVTAGFFLIILSQTISATDLWWWAPAVSLGSVIFAYAEWGRVMRRLRYIFLALVILFAWQTPGRMIIPALGALSPTWDGFSAVLDPALRLVSVVSVVALMLHILTTENWVSSLYVLVQPCRLIGLKPERFAVRLRLVLDYIERRDLDWRHCLTDATQEVIPIQTESWSVHKLGWHDATLMMCIGILLAGYLLW